jgi:hypothetical protein
LEALDAHATEHHRAEPAIAERQGLDPLPGGPRVGQLQQRCAAADWLGKQPAAQERQGPKRE